MEISDRMYPDRNWRVFLYDFPREWEENGRSGNSEEHSGRIEGCMIKRSEFGKFDGGFSGSNTGKQRN